MYLLIFILCEVFELLWQKAPTLLGVLTKTYNYYQKSPYLLYLMHPSYIFSIYLFYLSAYNLWILAILVIKSIDIMFKIILIQKYFILDELSVEYKTIFELPMHPALAYMGLSLYPYLLYLALF